MYVLKIKQYIIDPLAILAAQNRNHNIIKASLKFNNSLPSELKK
jgi:hypothetical protein